MIKMENTDKYQQIMELQQNIQYLEKYKLDIETQEKDLELIKESIQEISEVKSDSEILVPIVNGIFFKAKLTNATKFLVNIGAEGIVVEMDAQKAKKLILTQIETTKKNLELLSEDLNDMIKKLQELN